MDQIILGVYGLFLLVGGYFGFKKGSQVSLIMGTTSGILVFLGIWLLTINVHTAWIFLSGVTGLLSITFVMRLIKTKTFMPSGMLLLTSVGMLIFCLIHLK
jgi:uncharacterized membrane protein (UPF0136 family)